MVCVLKKIFKTTFSLFPSLRKTAAVATATTNSHRKKNQNELHILWKIVSNSKFNSQQKLEEIESGLTSLRFNYFFFRN